MHQHPRKERKRPRPMIQCNTGCRLNRTIWDTFEKGVHLSRNQLVAPEEKKPSWGNSACLPRPRSVPRTPGIQTAYSRHSGRLKHWWPAVRRAARDRYLKCQVCTKKTENSTRQTKAPHHRPFSYRSVVSKTISWLGRVQIGVHFSSRDRMLIPSLDDGPLDTVCRTVIGT